MALGKLGGLKGGKARAANSPEVYRYHVELCIEAGLIRSLMPREDACRLTWAGHDWLNEFKPSVGPQHPMSTDIGRSAPE